MTIEVNEKNDNLPRRPSENGLIQPKDVQPEYEVVEEIKIKYQKIPDKDKDTGPNILVLIIWIYLGLMLFASFLSGESPSNSGPYYNEPLPQYPTESRPNFE
jgi:hypothetical protein